MSDENVRLKTELFRNMRVPEEYIPFLIAMDHIKIENWGLCGNSRKVERWIKSEGKSRESVRRGFVKFHIGLTSEAGFVWKCSQAYT